MYGTQHTSAEAIVNAKKRDTVDLCRTTAP
jgi:hypothetical protein